MINRGRPAYVAAVVGLATIYVAAARFGLELDAVAGFATLVWPATGIALAALVTFGYRLWPGIFVGAVVANLLTGAPLLPALGIGVGNTLEAVVGTYALRRIPGFRPSLDRVRDVVGLIVLAAGLSTMVSATIGVASLYLGGVVSLGEAARAWKAWWLGDLIGNLVVAPVLLVLGSSTKMQLARHRVAEAVALVVSVLAVSFAIFGGAGGRAYLTFPPLIWAALRFGQHGAVSMTLLLSVVAVWGTAAGHGPFAQPRLVDSLFTLQTFMAVTAATFLIMGASITERRSVEERLRRAHETVAEANRAKAEFLAVMSHELRTPLNAISGYVELMSMEIADPITQTQRTYLSRIQSNQRQLLSMIDDVLSFAKVEAGRLKLDIETVRAADLLRGLEAPAELELRRRKLSFTCDPCDPSLTVQGDREKLRQILSNLVGNSMKFTPPGGRIGVGVARNGDKVRIWVCDTGIGIAPDQLERVFEPFYQVDRGMTRSHPGVGLGLAIARDFARAMGGDLRMESELGRGTTAVLELPAR
ncbi:MAG: MASE1 domain-containing protein [Gemmatimonadota bacterium]|nr:MASE1 domain-containing protein [Gemmatimonadota bacterium]